MGEAYALASAVSFGFAVILFRIAGQIVSPLGLNLFKNVICILFLLLSFFVVGEPFLVSLSLEDYILLSLSGIIGLAIADTLFFMSLNRLGATRFAIVDCLYSPSVIVFAYFYIGETLSLWQGLGGLLILTSIPLAEGRDDSEISHREFVLGAIYGGVAVICMGAGVVLMKPILAQTSVLWAATFRMFAGTGVLILLALCISSERRVFVLFRPQKSWKILIPTSILGTYVTLLFWVAGMKYTQSNVAAILNQSSTLVVVVLATLILKEKMTPKKAAAVAMAFAGALMVLLS